MSDWVERARAFADQVLFPTANDIDALDVLPRERLDRLAAEGWYSMAAPDSGVGFPEIYGSLEAFAGGCMTTTLVWLQHHGVLRACTLGPESVQHWIAPLASGDLRATVAFSGLRPTPTAHARREGDAWVIDGMAPWVSGWGLTDVIHVSARTEDDDVVWLLVDTSDPALRAQHHRLLALNASSTVTLHFDGVRVDGDRLTSRFPWVQWAPQDAMGLRTNGSLALGVAERCCRLVASATLDAELGEVRALLDGADVDLLPGARAAASAFAVQAAAAVVAHHGSGSVESGTHAERLVREATVLLVFASRPAIRSELLRFLNAT